MLADFNVKKKHLKLVEFPLEKGAFSITVDLGALSYPKNPGTMEGYRQ